MQNLVRDLRYALRTAGRNLGFTVVVVATLGLGIGANTAIFSVVDAVLLRALPFPESEQLVSIWADYTRRDGPLREWLSYPNIHDLRSETDVFAEVTAYNDWTPTLTGLGEAEQLNAALVTEGTFSRVLQVPPIVGRTFLPDDDRPNAPNVVLLSHGFWTRALGADPSVIGTTISLSEQPYTIVGVMPLGMRPPFLANAAFWAPLQQDMATTAERRGDAVLRSVARLQDGVGLETARARADAIGARLEQDYPEDNIDIGYAIFPLQEDMVRTARPTLWVLLGAVTFVLLVACVNVANLLLARTTARRGELAVRAALGAGGARIAQQILAESAVLAALGGIVGTALAFIGTDILVSLAPGGTPRIDMVRVDARVLAFTGVLTVAVGLVFGVFPALRAGRSDFHDALKEGGRGADLGRRGGRLRNALIVGQVALALLLLVGAGLFIQSLRHLNAVDPGFDPSGKLTMQLILPSNRYPDRAATTRFYVDLEDRLRALPGVDRVGSINSLPLAGLNGDAGFNILGRPAPPPGQARIAWIRRVTAGYFETMEISLIAGRGFRDSDDPDTPRVVVINETLAERYFPNQDPLGQRIYFGNPDPLYQREIVGVVENVKNFGIRRESPNAIYFPYRQLSSTAMFIAMETAGDPEALIPSVRRAVAEMDANLAVANIGTMESLLQGSLGSDRFTALLLSLFAGLALVLAAVGLYGVVSYNVSQRLREMGVRIALGAVSGDIHRMVIGRSLVLVGMGIGAGLVGAFGVSRLVTGLLYEVSPADPVTLAVTALALVLVAMAASAIPARRATRLDPVAVLNSE